MEDTSSKDYEFVHATQNNEVEGAIQNSQNDNERFMSKPWTNMTEFDEDYLSGEKIDPETNFLEFQLAMTNSQKKKGR